MSRSNEPLIFELSSPGRMGVDLSDCDVPSKDLRQLIPEHLIAQEGPDLPEVSEVDVIRHFTRLSRRNFGVDVGSYPLGSCTMKYNPKVNEDIAADAALGEGFRIGHSYFCGDATDARLVLRYELAPLVKEYWFDDPKKMHQELDKLEQALQ